MKRLPSCGESLSRLPIARHQLILADAGYCSIAGIEHVQQRGADVLVRVNPQAFVAYSQILTSHDKITGLEGVAGAGKTTFLAAVRETAEHEGYKVFGLGPTARAAQKLAESGIESGTLQRHLVRGEQPDGEQKRLYVLDESSLASTRNCAIFLQRM